MEFLRITRVRSESMLLVQLNRRVGFPLSRRKRARAVPTEFDRASPEGHETQDDGRGQFPLPSPHSGPTLRLIATCSRSRHVAVGGCSMWAWDDSFTCKYSGRST